MSIFAHDDVHPSFSIAKIDRDHVIAAKIGQKRFSKKATNLRSATFINKSSNIHSVLYSTLQP